MTIETAQPDALQEVYGAYAVRSWHAQVEEVRHAGGPVLDQPLLKAAVAVVIANPFAGRWVEDLSSLTAPSAALGTELGRRAVALLGGRPVESYGKGAVIGIAAEQEHGVALLTTVFGNVIRDTSGGGKAWISSMTKRAAPGATIDVPVAHKDALYVRSHYDGITITLADAPLPDEIAIVCVYVNRGRLNARVGGLSKDKIKGIDGLV